MPTSSRVRSEGPEGPDLLHDKDARELKEQEAELSKNDHVSLKHRTSKGGTYDVEAALHAVEGDRELLHTLIGIFLESSPSVMKQLEDAFHAGEYTSLHNHAHQLKGSLGTLHALDAAAAAARLEKLSKLNDADALKLAFVQFEEEYRGLLAVLQLLVSGDSSLSLEKTMPTVSS